MKFSEYQLKLFDCYNTQRTNICISAGPGSGKTTSVVEMLRYKRLGVKTHFLSFSKAIVEELKHRLPSSITASTVHGACYKALSRHYDGHVILQDNKALRMTFDVLGASESAKDINNFKAYCINISKLIDAYRLFLCDDYESLERAAQILDLDLDMDIYTSMMEVFDKMMKLAKSKPTKSKPVVIDFVDQLFLTYRFNLKVAQYDEVVIDEAQDCSVLQQKLIRRMIAPGGRYIAVGDEKQCIFGFIGSDPNAFENWKAGATVLQLPISYRCSKAAIKLINSIHPGTVPNDIAADGELQSGSIESAVAGDFILCRNNAPLLSAYFYLIGKRKSCYIRDNDFSSALIKILEPFGNTQLSLCINGAQIKLQELFDALLAKGVKNPSKHPKYVEMEEHVDAIKGISSHFTGTANDVVRVLFEANRQAKQDPRSSIQLMTFHKSKGLESDRIFVIRADKWPSSRAASPEQKLQERNLMFVALSRSKDQIIFDTEFNCDTDDKARSQCSRIYNQFSNILNTQDNGNDVVQEIVEDSQHTVCSPS